MRFLLLAALALVPLAADALADTGSISLHPTSRFVVSHPELRTDALALKVPRQAVVRGAEVQRYSLMLSEGEFAAIKVRQTAGNVAVALFSPDGRLIDLADRSGDGFDETVVVAAKMAGQYAIQVAMFEWDTVASTYTVELVRREAGGKTPAAIAGQLLGSWYDPAHAGAAVAVVYRNRVVFQRTIGLANADNKTAITPETRFDLASVSKQFTAYGIATLIAQGKLDFNDDVRRYLPEVPQFEKTITLHHLLDHTSGLRDWDAAFGLMGLTVQDGITKEAVLDMVSRQTKLNFTPGSAQEYSNTGYALLAAVIERVTKERFGDWTQRNVFAPAAMTAIANDDPWRSIDRRANSYGKRYPSPHLISGQATATAGSGSVHASLNDMVAWAMALRGRAHDGSRVTELTGKPDRLDNGTKIDYGFGQWFRERSGVRFIGHLGLAAGFRTSFRRFPERDLAVIFLANDGDDAAFSRATTIESLFLGIPEEPVAVPDGEYTPPSTVQVPAQTARDMAGLYYSDELRTAYEVRATPSGLMAYHAINGAIALVPDKDEAFHTDRFFMPLVAFDRDARGIVIGFRASTEAARDMFFRKIVP